MYTLLIIFIVKYSNRGTPSGDEKVYLVGTKDMEVFEVACSIVAAVIDPASILFGFGIILIFGPAGAGLFSAFFVTTFLLGFLAPKFWNKAETGQVHTLSNFVGLVVGKKSEFVYGLVTLLFVMTVVIGAYSANLDIFKHFLQLDKFSATVITFGLTLAYVVVGGFRTIVRTDVLQYVLMVLVFGAICLALPAVVTQVDYEFSKWFTGAFWMLGPVIFFQNIVKPAQWQPLLGAKSAEVATKGVFLGGLLYVALMAPIIYVAFTLKAVFPGTEPMQVFYQVVGTYFLDYSPFVFIAMVAALMSSVDTALFYVGTTAASIFNLKKYFKDVSGVRLIQVTIGVISFVTILLSMFVESFITFLLSTVPMVGVVVLPFFGGMLFDLKKFDKEIAISMVLGVVVFFFQFANPATDYIWNILPVVTTFAVFLVLSGIKKL